MVYYQFSKEILALEIEVAQGFAVIDKSHHKHFRASHEVNEKDRFALVCDHEKNCLLLIDVDSGKVIEKLFEGHFELPTNVVVFEGRRQNDSLMVVVTDRRAKNIQLFNLNQRKFIRKFEIDENSEQFVPHAIAFDAQSHNIVVTDRGEHQVYIYDAESGKIKNSFGSLGLTEGKLCGPRGIAVDNNGHIVVCDTQNHRLQVFNTDGEYLRSVGYEGHKPGQLVLPTSISIDHKGNYVVLDAGNKRIQVFDSKSGSCCFVWSNDLLVLPSGISADHSSNRIVVSDLHSLLIFEQPLSQSYA